MEVVGIHSVFRGLLNKEVKILTRKTLSGLLSQGGTILRSFTRETIQKRTVLNDVDKPAVIKQIHRRTRNRLHGMYRRKRHTKNSGKVYCFGSQ